MESRKHQELCRRVFSRFSKRFLQNSSIFAQTLALPRFYPPQPINGYIPDILILNKTSTNSIIGEAKTEEDINNSHTADQLEAYLSFSYGFKNFKVFYEVDIVCVSLLRHLFYKARISRNLHVLRNVFINGVLFK